MGVLAEDMYLMDNAPQFAAPHFVQFQKECSVRTLSYAFCMSEESVVFAGHRVVVIESRHHE
jgi:hypothetical protein